jgi:hypothetical protein
MAEDFELVRTYRQHLKRAGALLDEERFDDALHEVEQALLLDAHSVPAQALRDRIRAARARVAPVMAAETAAQPGKGFVPYGVNAASWRGFEQRITDRRVRALLDTANTAIVAGDAVAARIALEEARELKPGAPELPELEARLAALPPPAPPEPVNAPRIWMRAFGAAAMFLIGVSLLIGVEWLRPIDTITPSTTLMTTAPDAAPTPDYRATPEAGAIAVESDEDESIPAIITPPEPLLQPRGTSGTIPATETRPVARNDAPAPAAPPAPVPVAPSREVGDDFAVRPDVARAENTAPEPESLVARASETIAADAEPAPAGPALDAAPPAAAAIVPAAALPRAAAVPPPDRSRVEEVLRRYASAYRALDASAARAVWPSVDEKALARAFQNLESQNLSFDACDIDIRGAVANASCRGEASYIGKVGSREPRTEQRTWQFELRLRGESWLIEGVDARRRAAAASYQER